MTRSASNDLEVGEVADRALHALRGPGRSVAQREVVDSAPGLYAVHAAPRVWRDLELGDPPDDRPLYVGKAESSLVSRDLETHFGVPRRERQQSITGSSTLRRSLAALLAPSNGYRGLPRNPNRPGHYANFGLSFDQDCRLTDWMTDHLTLAVWAKDGTFALDAIETRVLSRLSPPLNLVKVAQPWRPQVKAAREVLAHQAKKAAGDGRPGPPAEADIAP